MTVHLPPALQYGFVADRVVRAVGDTEQDPDRYPDGIPAAGTVEFTPLQNVRYTEGRPATRVSLATITCTIYQGDDPDDPNFQAERAGMIVDPAGHIGNVALVVGDYKVATHLDDGTFDTFDITVTPEHTEANPLWLADEVEREPSTYERFVVNERVYREALDARDEAITASNAATIAADRAEAPTDEMVGNLIGQPESSTKTALDNEMAQKFGGRMSRTHIVHRDGMSNGMRNGSDDYVAFDSIYHVYDGSFNVTGYLYGLSRILVGGMEQAIWRSRDVGQTWEKLFTMPVDQPAGVWYEDLFVTINETFHLQKTTSGFTTPRENFVDTFNIGGYMTSSLNVGNSYWLGATQSIDNGPTADWSARVTMFGEYALDAKDTVNIWRSTDNGTTWDIALSLPGNNGVVGSGEVRHAHAVNYDPRTSHWWAAFGDMNDQCRIYRSTDAGLTWDIMWEGTQRERTCGFLFTRDFIYYGMDEAKAGTDHSKIVRINKATLEREDVATVKDGLPVFQLTRTYAPAGFIVWPMYERGASDRPERITVQWFDFQTHKLHDIASYLIEGEESMEGFQTAGRAQDTRDGSFFFRPTPSIQYAGDQNHHTVSTFSRGTITEN